MLFPILALIAILHSCFVLCRLEAAAAGLVQRRKQRGSTIAASDMHYSTIKMRVRTTS